jgi:hypothetical protein
MTHGSNRETGGPALLPVSDRRTMVGERRGDRTKACQRQEVNGLSTFRVNGYVTDCWEILVCQEGWGAVRLSGIGELLICSEQQRCYPVRNRSAVSLFGTRKMFVCQEEELSVKDTRILWSVRNKMVRGLSVRWSIMDNRIVRSANAYLP